MNKSVKLNSSTISLGSSDYKNLEEVISRIASMEGIDNVETVHINLKADDGVIQFKTAFDIGGALEGGVVGAGKGMITGGPQKALADAGIGAALGGVTFGDILNGNMEKISPLFDVLGKTLPDETKEGMAMKLKDIMRENGFKEEDSLLDAKDKILDKFNLGALKVL